MLKNIKSSITDVCWSNEECCYTEVYYVCCIWVHLFESPLIDFKSRSCKKIPSLILLRQKGLSWGFGINNWEVLECWDLISQNCVYLSALHICMEWSYVFLCIYSDDLWPLLTVISPSKIIEKMIVKMNDGLVNLIVIIVISNLVGMLTITI